MKTVNKTWIVWVCEMIHGAGIDTVWTVEEYPMGWICSSDWHAMNQDGFYVGYIPFRLVVNRKGMLIKANLDKAAIKTILKENSDESGESNVCLDDLDDLEDYLYQTWSGYSGGHIEPSDEWARAIEEDAFDSGTLSCPRVYSVKVE